MEKVRRGMSIFNDSFLIELNHPLDEEAWKVIEDAELDNTEHIYFTTPSGERVDFIKADVLDKIIEEIMDNTYFINELTEKEGIDFEIVENIIDKYRAKWER